MKYQNLVFLPASDALRSDLYKLGLDFLLVRLEGKLQFMIVTNQLNLAGQLAHKHGHFSFHVSDSRRQLFEVSSVTGKKFTPTKLGKLSRDANKSGKAFLVVTEGNAQYHYIVE